VAETYGMSVNRYAPLCEGPCENSMCGTAYECSNSSRSRRVAAEAAARPLGNAALVCLQQPCTTRISH
jgi:hypothetical protein